MTKVVAPTGVKGIDVTTERGTRKYDADSKGYINIENGRHLKQALAEGMSVAASAAGFGRAQGFPCPCGHQSLFRQCGKCGKEN